MGGGGGEVVEVADEAGVDALQVGHAGDGVGEGKESG